MIPENKVDLGISIQMETMQQIPARYFPDVILMLNIFRRNREAADLGLFDYRWKYFQTKNYEVSEQCQIFENKRPKVIKPQKTGVNLRPLTKTLTLKRNFKKLRTELDEPLSTRRYTDQSITNRSIQNDQLKQLEQKNERPLGKVWYNQYFGTFTFARAQKYPSQSEPYLVVKSLVDNFGNKTGYRLKQGDIIKFGRFQFLVRSSEVSNTNWKVNLGSMCRICMFQEQNQQDFLIAPCKCKGSCRYMHIKCLKRWLVAMGNRNKNKNKESISYKCEICQSVFPRRVKRNGKFYSLFENRSDIFLQKLNPYPGKTKIIILQQSYPIYISKDGCYRNYIQLKDDTISQCHAKIQYQNGQFYLYDHCSQYGTLVKIQDRITYRRCDIQIGQTILKFSVNSMDQTDTSKSIYINTQICKSQFKEYKKYQIYHSPEKP